MWTIDRELILDVAASLEFSEAVIVEKDFRVVEALAAVLAVPAPKGIRLVFAGGTCLARAHRLISRMSEDIDLKVVVDPGAGYSKSSLRTALSSFKESIAKELTDRNFVITKLTPRNDNKYVCFEVDYGAGRSDDPLRPHIQIETTVAEIRLATVRRDLSSFVAEATGKQSELSGIECISIDETAAEKLVSLTRRTAAMLEGTKPETYDRFLVRHIYDLHWCKPVIDQLVVSNLAQNIAIDDAEQFGTQFPAYREDPEAWTKKALDWLASKDEPRANYQQFLDGMVYGEHIDFDTAMASVKELAEAMWQATSFPTP